MKNIENFRKSLKFVLSKEGGYTNNPADAGGPTKWGITQRTYDAYRRSLNQPTQSVSLLTPEEAADIYAHQFWDMCSCDSLAYPLCTVVFDSAVQHGPPRAVGWLKAAPTIAAYLDLRKQFYLSIVKKDPTQQVFLKGWLARLADLQKLVEVTQADVDYDVTQLPDWHY